MRNIIFLFPALLIFTGCGHGRLKAMSEGPHTTEALGQQTILGGGDRTSGELPTNEAGEQQLVSGEELPTGEGRRTNGDKDAQPGRPEQKAAAKPFPHVKRPMYINSDEAMHEYLIMHFWDRFDFSDPSYIEAEELAKAYRMYVSLLTKYPDKALAQKSIGAVMKKAEKYPAMYDCFWDLADEYLYNANSPARDDEIYETVLESVLANPAVDELLKISPREKLAIVGMNKPGTRANNFSYKSSKGKKGNLHDIKAEYTLVFFYNLGCSACKQTREGIMYLMQDPAFAEFVNSGRLRIVAMYPDTNMEEWNKYLGDIPANWINAYDPTKDNRIANLYDLKAIPSLYLLDKDKNVILKDFTDPSKLYHTLIRN